MTGPVIQKSIFLYAPCETVWSCLTDAKKLGQWFHPAQADLTVGQPYRLMGAVGEAICWGM